MEDINYSALCFEIICQKTNSPIHKRIYETYYPYKNQINFRALLNFYDQYLINRFNNKSKDLSEDFFEEPEDPDEHNNLDTYDKLFQIN